MNNNKKYLSIDEVSKLLNINKHVIRYWDSKFDCISTRIEDKKQRFFNNSNVNKIKEINKILYNNGKHIYSLDLVNKFISQPKKESNILNNTNKINVLELKKISSNLKKLFID